MILIF